MGRVDALIRELNAEEILPRFAYRRNAPIYPLVCTVNGIIGCYLSNNKDVISVLVERARLFMADNPANNDNLRYYELVHEMYVISVRSKQRQHRPSGWTRQRALLLWALALHECVD